MKILSNSLLLSCQGPKFNFHHLREIAAGGHNQRRSEGTSSVAFEVLIINCQTYFINSFIFNCLTLNMKLFIFKLFDVKIFVFRKPCLSQTEENGCLWSYGCAFLVLDFKLTWENDDLLSSIHK